MPPPRFWPVVIGLTLVGCDKPPQPPDSAEVFPNLPLPPNATFVSRSGGSDALQITLRSPVKAAAVAGYYRSVLSKGGWRLVSDAKDPKGAIVLLAEQKGPPLWVRISSIEDSAATLVQLTGAVVRGDSAKAGPS